MKDYSRATPGIDNLFQANLRRMERSGRFFFNPADLLNVDTSRYELKQARSGGDYLVIRRWDGALLPLNSPINPVLEAHRIVNEGMGSGEDPNSVDTIIVIGLECGHLLEAVQEHYPKVTQIFLWEPCVEAFVTTIRSRELNPTHSWTVNYLANLDPRRASAIIASLLDPYKIKGLKVFSNPRLVQCNKEAVKAFSEDLRARTSASKLLIGTSLRHGELFFRNFLANIPFILGSTHIDVVGEIVRDKRCIITSAGPSLEKQLPILKRVERKVPIICVGPAWKTLRLNNIIPDVVFSIDPFAPNFEHFDGLEGNGEILASCLSNNHDIVKGFAGTQVFFHTNKDTGWLAEALGIKTPFMACGGSVAHAAFSFCQYYGACEIILVGQDLAYTNGVSHAIGHTGITELATDKERYPDRFLSVPAYGGQGIIETNIQMDSYRLWFENQTGLDRVINATEGGCRIQGIREEPFRCCVESDLNNAHEVEVHIRQSKTLTSGKALSKKFLAVQDELNSLRLYFSELKGIMEALKCISDLDDRGSLEAKYNSVAKKPPRTSALTKSFLEHFSRDEVFRASRRLNIFKEDRAAHYETNLALHQRLERSCQRALEVVSLVINKIAPEHRTDPGATL